MELNHKALINHIKLRVFFFVALLFKLATTLYLRMKHASDEAATRAIKTVFWTKSPKFGLPPFIFSSSTSWSSSTSGDLLGTESGVHMTADEEIVPPTTGGGCRQKSRIQRRKDKVKKKEYPPPIPLLARRRSKVSGKSMYWIMSREYVDGKLILREALYELLATAKPTESKGDDAEDPPHESRNNNA